MRVPRVRFTVRRMMVAVAILAVLMGGMLGAWRRQERFMRLSRAHSAKAGWLEMEAFGPRSVMNRAERSAAMNAVHWHDAVAWRYRHAASRPWLTVEPDPPVAK